MTRSGSARHSRVDTMELKALIIRKVGHYRSEKYLDQLRKLFTLKISKSEFDKLLIRIIGRENLPLHNMLIKSIIKNACLAKVPPRKSSLKSQSALNAKISPVNQRNGVQTPCVDAFRSSPHNSRYQSNRDCRLKDFRSHDSTSKALEHQSATELHSLGSRPPASVEDGEEVEQMAGSPCVQSRISVTAPLGISMNFHSSRKSLPTISLSSKHYSETCQSCGELPDTKSLRERLEQKFEMEGLGVTLDCVNLLNNSLDSYLKRLIESCMSLGGSRSGNEHDKQQQQQHGKLILGSNALLHRRYILTEKESTVTLSDFHAAMELNPKILGGDWASQLEKMSMRHSQV